MSNVVSLAIGINAHERIDSLRKEMRLQKQDLDESELSAASMRQDIEKLYLLVEALWAILKTTANLKDDDLKELVRQIDLRDGRLDGRNAANADVRTCEACGRTILRGQPRCSWCGEALRDGALFRHNGK